MRRMFLLLSVFFVSHVAIAQQNSITSDNLRQLWSDFNDSTHTPLRYVSVKPLDDDCDTVCVKVENCVFRPITPSERYLCQFLNLDTALTVESVVLKTRKKPFVQYGFAPFVKGSSGDTLVVSDFNIVVQPGKKNTTEKTISCNASNSLLSSGKWFKIKVDTTGVYKLTFDNLKSIGIDNPQNTRLFSCGGRQLPYYCSNDSPDDLCEIPVIREFGPDGVFGSGDYLIFYAQGPVTLNYDKQNGLYSHEKHCYSDYTYIFLTSDLGEGKQMKTESTQHDAEYTTDTYDCYRYYDVDKCNLVSSGRRWYDSKMTVNKTDSLPFYFPNIVKKEPVKCQVFAAGRKASGVQSTYFKYGYNGRTLKSSYVQSCYDTYVYAEYNICNFDIVAVSPNVRLTYSLNSPSNVSEGYIDKICMTARAGLIYSGKEQLHFRDSRSMSAQFAEFCLNSNGTDVRILDVTAPTSPEMVNVAKSGSVLTFTVETNGMNKEFVAFDVKNLSAPIVSGNDLGSVDNQNLHGESVPDMLIVTYPDFWSQAEELAEMHRVQDGFDVKIVTPQQVYNEFSNGAPDVSAIRNYARFLYKKDSRFRYLLLFGDGSYDNKNINGSGGNYILTFQSLESESNNRSYVCDDFFAMLDDGEGELTGTLDIGVGRLPAANQKEAQVMVDKIKRYTSGQDSGAWRNSIIILADDEEEGAFERDAEHIFEFVDSKMPAFNVSKIYLDAYEQVSGSSGATYPDVTEVFRRQLSAGAVLVNYIGHGNPTKITHESIFKVNDVNSLSNIDRLPFFITASCEVGRFDDYTFTSFGESLVKNPHGGAIAALVTTRVVYDDANHELNKKLYMQLHDGNSRFGDMVSNAKNATGTDSQANKRNFTLLGDPAIRLVHPDNNIIVTKINGRLTNSSVYDTINAIDTVTMEGYVCDPDGVLLAENGVMYSTIYDKPITESTRGNDQTSPVINYTTQNSVLFKGRTSIRNGLFSFSFIVPKDINYSYGFGKISLYAALEHEEAAGYSKNIFIGGTPEQYSLTDIDGPEIDLYMNDTNYMENNIVGTNPIVIAKLFDESGINTTGNGIGHDITAVLDGNFQSPIILNDYFEGYIDRSNSGEVKFKLYDLPEGEHTLTFKAWDIYNNSADAEISFVVKNSNSAFVGNVYNYPNPASSDTYFVINHNQTEAELNVIIKIRDLAGREFATINTRRGVGDTSPIHWMCQQNGKPIANGIYVYTVEISGSAGKSTKSGKMIISRQ